MLEYDACLVCYACAELITLCRRMQLVVRRLQLPLLPSSERSRGSRRCRLERERPHHTVQEARQLRHPPILIWIWFCLYLFVAKRSYTLITKPRFAMLELIVSRVDWDKQLQQSTQTSVQTGGVTTAQQSVHDYKHSHAELKW